MKWQSSSSVVQCFKTLHFRQNSVCLVFSAIFVSLWLKIFSLLRAFFHFSSPFAPFAHVKISVLTLCLWLRLAARCLRGFISRGFCSLRRCCFGYRFNSSKSFFKKSCDCLRLYTTVCDSVWLLLPLRLIPLKTHAKVEPGPK